MYDNLFLFRLDFGEKAEKQTLKASCFKMISISLMKMAMSHNLKVRIPMGFPYLLTSEIISDSYLK